MTARISHGNGLNGYVLFYLGFAYWARSDNWGDSYIAPSAAFKDVLIKFDPFFRQITSWGYHLSGGYRNLPLPSEQDMSKELLLSRPVLSHPNQGDGYDLRTYATTLHNISSFLSVVTSGSLPELPSTLGENFARHATYRGHGLFPKLPNSAVALFNEDTDWIPRFNGTVCNMNHLDNDIFFDVINPAGSITTYHSGSGNRRSMNDLIGRLSHLSDGFSSGTGTQNWRLTGNISYVTDDDLQFTFRCKCNLFLGGPYNGYPDVNYSWDYTFSLQKRLTLNSVHLKTNGDGSIGLAIDDSLCSIKFHSIVCDRSYDVSPITNIHDVNVYYGAAIYGTPTYILNPDDTGLNIGRPSISSSLDSFKRFADSRFVDIVPASSFSAVDAILNLEHGTSTDVLQTLAKLPSISSAIPKYKEALSVLSHIVKKDINLMTLKDIVDLGTSTVLQSSFQWRPLLQLVTVEMPKILSSLGAFYSGKHLVATRGSYTYDFIAGEFPRDNVRLTVHSKIVLDLSARALASSLMGYDAFGILPKPSNLWDLVPFSFVLNWFTGIGTSMKRLEYLGAMLNIPASYVHTYTITSPFSADELEHWNLQSSPHDPLSFKLFYRDVSLYTPLPRYGGFGFGIPTQLPPVGTLGSLLYQILF